METVETMGLGAEAYLDPALRGLGHLSVLLGCAILTAIFHTRPGVMPEGHRERRQDGIRKRVSNAYEFPCHCDSMRELTVMQVPTMSATEDSLFREVSL